MLVEIALIAVGGQVIDVVFLDVLTVIALGIRQAGQPLLIVTDPSSQPARTGQGITPEK